jgi:hypothetical protein
MARKVSLRRNPHGGDLPYDEWIPAHAVKFNENGSVSVMTEEHRQNRGRRRNVTAGFYDEEGMFHPIRASYDYSRSRAGERAKRHAPKRRSRAKAKRRRR